MRYIALCVFLLASLDARALVLSSIKPIDLIVRDLTGGEPASFVLLDASTSPHHYTMKISDARRLKESDLFIWVGPRLESFLAKPVKNRLGPTLMLAELFENAQFSHQDHHHHDHHSEISDSHLWLSYDNAMVIATQIAQTLAIQYPHLEDTFNNNLSSLLSKLRLEKTKTFQMLEQMNTKGFAVYHDGYSAYVEEFGLTQLAHVTLMPDEQISLKKLMVLKSELAEASCLLGEQAEFKKVQRLASKLELSPVAVDLLGSEIERERGTTHFVRYMQKIRSSFLSCLRSAEDDV